MGEIKYNCNSGQNSNGGSNEIKGDMVKQYIVKYISISQAPVDYNQILKILKEK